MDYREYQHRARTRAVERLHWFLTENKLHTAVRSLGKSYALEVLDDLLQECRVGVLDHLVRNRVSGPLQHAYELFTFFNDGEPNAKHLRELYDRWCESIPRPMLDIPLAEKRSGLWTRRYKGFDFVAQQAHTTRRWMVSVLDRGLDPYELALCEFTPDHSQIETFCRALYTKAPDSLRDQGIPSLEGLTTDR